MLKVLSVSTVLLSSTSAASATETRVVYGDLNLATANGAAVFDARLRRAADEFCNGLIGLLKTDCQVAVRAEALERLPPAIRRDYRRGQRASARPLI